MFIVKKNCKNNIVWAKLSSTVINAKLSTIKNCYQRKGPVFLAKFLQMSLMEFAGI